MLRVHRCTSTNSLTVCEGERDASDAVRSAIVEVALMILPDAQHITLLNVHLMQATCTSYSSLEHDQVRLFE